MSAASTSAERRVPPLGRRPRAGFTLLEVMVALAILALALGVISAAVHSSVRGSVKTYRMTVAALLMRGVVMDIEEEYKADGFPSNDVTNESCDVPEPWDDVFECHYDLEGMQLEPGQLEAVVTSAFSSLGGQGEGGAGAGGGQAPDVATQLQGLVSPSLMPTLQAMVAQAGPQAVNDFITACGVDISKLLGRIMGMAAFFPQFVQLAADSTRKLTVTLSWKDGPRGQRELKVETFIVAMNEEQNDLLKLLPGSSGGDSTGGPGRGQTGGARGGSRGGRGGRR